MKKILFVVQNMNIGGVQRAFVNTVNYMAAHGYDIDVFSFAPGPLKEELHPNVSVLTGRKLLNLLLTPIDVIRKDNNTLDLFLRYILVLCAKVFGIKTLYYCLFRQEKKLGHSKYDVAVSYFNDVFIGISNKGANWFVSDFVNAKKKVAWIHTDPEKARFDKNECEITYRYFDSIVCVSEAIKIKMNQLIPKYSGSIEVVYNYFPVDKIKQKSLQNVHNVQIDNKRFNIITIGRVENGSKRMDRIIYISEMMKAHGYNNVTWWVVGDGPDLKNVKNLAKSRGVLDYITFTGELDNPYYLLSHSNLFVLTSDYEGYPMVIGEALTLGVPVITTRFAAANEMIINGENGFICGMNETELYNMISLLIDNQKKYNLIKEKVKTNSYVNMLWEKQIDRIFNYDKA